MHHRENWPAAARSSSSLQSQHRDRCDVVSTKQTVPGTKDELCESQSTNRMAESRREGSTRIEHLHCTKAPTRVHFCHHRGRDTFSRERDRRRSGRRANSAFITFCSSSSSSPASCVLIFSLLAPSAIGLGWSTDHGGRPQ